MLLSLISHLLSPQLCPKVFSLCLHFHCRQHVVRGGEGLSKVTSSTLHFVVCGHREDRDVIRVSWARVTGCPAGGRGVYWWGRVLSCCDIFSDTLSQCPEELTVRSGGHKYVNLYVITRILKKRTLFFPWRRNFLCSFLWEERLFMPLHQVKDNSLLLDISGEVECPSGLHFSTLFC